MKAIRSVKISYAEISKFPAVKRDLALLLDKNVQFAEIEKIAYETEKKLLKEVYLSSMCTKVRIWKPVKNRMQ